MSLQGFKVRGMKLKTVLVSGAAIAVAGGLAFGGFAIADQATYVAPASPATTVAPAPTPAPQPTETPAPAPTVDPTPAPAAPPPPVGIIHGKAPVSTTPSTPAEPADPHIVNDPGIAPPNVYHQTETTTPAP